MQNIIKSNSKSKEIKKLKINFSAIKNNLSVTPQLALSDDKKRLTSQIQGVISESTNLLRATAIHSVKSDSIPLEIINHEMTIKERLAYVSSNRAINKGKLLKNIVINGMKPIDRLVDNYEKGTEYLIKAQGSALVSALICSTIFDGGITLGSVVSSGAILNGVVGLAQGVAQTSISTFNGVENLKEQINQPKNIKDAKNTIKNVKNQDDFYNPQEKTFSDAVGVLVENTNAQIYPLIQKIKKNDKIFEGLLNSKETPFKIDKISNKLKEHAYIALQYEHFKHIARISKPLEHLEKSSVIAQKDSGLYINMMR
jgi:hypothetical protein